MQHPHWTEEEGEEVGCRDEYPPASDPRVFMYLLHTGQQGTEQRTGAERWRRAMTIQ